MTARDEYMKSAVVDYAPDPIRDAFATLAQGRELEPRRSQQLMALAVQVAIARGKVLAVQAPCGTGKSFAYGVPAMLAAKKSTRIVIATANKTLQDQLYLKDLPILRDALAPNVQVRRLKGVGNYLCNLKALQPDLPGEVARWIRTTETGELGELSEELDWRTRAEITTSSDDCPGMARCPVERCWVYRARSAAQAAEIVVTNHHLFFADYASGGRLLGPYSVAILDECFVAGTQVGDRPIEEIRLGDLVPSYDERTGAFVRRRVTRVFSSRPSALVRITIGGRAIVCTPGHPFMTSYGWVPASLLDVGDLVLSSSREKDHGDDALRSVREDGFRNRQGDVRLPETRPSLLLPGTRKTEHASIAQPGPGFSASSTHIVGTHAQAQPDEGPKSPRQGVAYLAGDRSPATVQGGQRNKSPESATQASVAAALANGGCNLDRTKTPRMALALQDRHRKQPKQSGDRSGWLLAHGAQAPQSGPTQRSIPAFARVVRLEVLEPGSDGTYGGLCPDGKVYNLEVEGTHTYVAEGLVVHNCHEAADIAREILGWTLSHRGIIRFAGMARAVGFGTTRLADLVDHSESFFEAAKRWMPKGSDQIILHGNETWPGTDDLAGELRTVQRKAMAVAGDSEDHPARFVSDHAMRLLGRLAGLGSGADVLYVERVGDRSSYARFQFRPLELGGVLAGLWDRTIVLTSATLAPGGDFGYLDSELGVPKGAERVMLDSPFKLAEQALVVVPGDDEICDPNDEQFEVMAARALHFDIIRATGGGVLALFTATKRMERVAKLVRGWGSVILVQGEAPKEALLEQFIAEPDSVLFGVASFWTGVDVPGDSLRAVVIDRLPFPRPDEPVNLAMSKRLGRGAFRVYALPRAALRLMQGAGRLVRRSSDRGVIVILDRRAFNYGGVLLKALRPIHTVRGLSNVERWFR